MDLDRRQSLLLLLSSSACATALAQPNKKRAAAPKQAAPPAVLLWKPRPLFNGSPVLFTCRKPAGEATWMRKTIEFRQDGEKSWTALAGVNLDAKPGRYPLVIGSGEAAGTYQIAVVAHVYRFSRLTVPPQFVKPPAELEKRIAAERELKKKVFASSPAAERRWKGKFAPPAGAAETSPFGTRRVYNGKTNSIHQGLDFAAAIGTEIHAANSGTVVIARDMYFEGGCIVIDHGESIFTLYMHLSEFLVKEGVKVEKGQPIAKSGASGRVTGPHLHFAVQWQGAYLEPATLLRL